MANAALIAILVIIFVLVVVVLPWWGVRRTIPFVIRIFRNGNAVGKQNAKTIDELGLKPTRKGMIEMMIMPRDYRLAALRSLVKANVVQRTEETKFYLSEENLAASNWKSH